MGRPGKSLLTILLTIILTVNCSFAQIIFKELPRYELKSSDSLFFDLSRARSIIPLNGKWTVFPEDDADKKVSVNIPSIFKGDGTLIFQKYFRLTPEQVNNHNLKIFFLGLNYTADISVNNVIIYRHSGGEFPFSVVLPRDILKKDRNNVLSVKLNYELDSENTIPVKQRFLFPQSFGGILRDVYLQLIPNISISEYNIRHNYIPSAGRAVIKINALVDNREFRRANDSTSPGDLFSLRITINGPGGQAGSSSADFQLPYNKEKNVTQQVDLYSPSLWSPADPSSYTVRMELWRGDRLIDISRTSLAVYSLATGRDSLLLNGSPFALNGTTFIPCYYGYGNLSSYDQMERDIRIIKDAGFNAVRFAKNVPHPYYLALCERYGLLAFIELPLQSIPGSLTSDPNFLTRSRNYLSNLIKGYRKYSAVAGISLGSGYLPSVKNHIDFIENLAGIVHKDIDALSLACFSGYDIPGINNLDLYGIEFLNTSIPESQQQIKELQEKLGTGKVIISSATYVVNKGNSDGYVNEGTYEAQAKYYEELLDYTDSNPLAGYFINTMFDYRGDYSSLIGGYNSDNIYHIGIAGEDRNLNRLAYKVISAKLHNTEKVTIPIGNKKDNAPMMYIVFGLVLALFMGILVNSGRKFREDSSRALLRPYNFFADVRDQRIMSGPHTTMLMIVVAAVAALIISNILSFLKEDLFFENLLLAFGSHKVMKTTGYLAWHPVYSLIYLTAAFIIMLIVITIIVKIGSFFVRNRVYLSSVYFTVVWSFLPLVLLIPAGIVLYRLLSAESANIYIYGGLLLCALWIFYRLMKGIYVIFDVNAGSVYFYSILLVVLVVGGTLLYYEINNSVVDYLQLTLKQFNQGM